MREPITESVSMAPEERAEAVRRAREKQRSWLWQRTSMRRAVAEAVAIFTLGRIVSLLPVAIWPGPLIVLAPLIQPTVLHYLLGLEGVEDIVTILRYGITSLLLVLALVAAHKWLPSGRRRANEIAPGIVVTLLLWMVSAFAFSRYLAAFSNAYVRTYAGLASAMVALVFLYWTAGIFVYGGELNQAIRELVDQLNDRPMRGWGTTRRALYEQVDRPALRSLPPTPYEYADWKRCRVNLDYHVEVDKHF